MPFPILAHQAPVLPLKAWHRSGWNGTALVLGSLAPDLQYFWDGPGRAAEFGHTFAGQFTFCLPITMGVVLLVGHLKLGEVLAARVGKPLAWLVDAATDVTRPGGVTRAAMSALVGSFSHLAFDALTHEVVPAQFPHTIYHVRHLTFTVHAVSQGVASVVGAVISLWLLRRIARQRASEMPARRGGGWLLVPFAIVGGVVGWRRSIPALRHPNWYFEAAHVYVWGYIVFLVIAGAAAGVLVAGSVLAALDRRARNQSARTASATVVSPSGSETRGA